ncbi:hypothetical protein DBR43_27510 [Pedobacter sp. KBW06]|uniref:hypothetical protein n=1 Tax=Pedobacter sp. KBW06 TaxID=2153359 RepID=UPI000F596C2E|nr:hypothetical protein [Pedobacter sp. KBW06]RQO65994.1 hypothetical protein DBR43_27510 [Pedobacter sp. KBW06]
MKENRSLNYSTKALLIFLLLLITALLINFIGNSWLYGIKHSNDKEKLAVSVFNFKSALFLAFQLTKTILVVSLLLSALLKLINVKIHFTRILYVVISAEFIFILQSIFDLVWVFSHKEQLTITEIIDFQSFSIYNLLKNVPSYLFYAATTANLWEILYMMILAYLLKEMLNRSMLQSFGLVILSYGLPLLLWLIFATFIQISNA